MTYDIQRIREDFPILSRSVYDKPLVYLDNAATTQKPLCVLDAMRDEYLNVNANVHRGVHYLSQQATDLHEAARERVRRFINAHSTSEIIFTRGTTEGLNLIASSFCEAFMKEGDEIIISVMEHHSNIVPWQLQAAKRGICIRVIPMNEKGEVVMEEYERLFTEKTKLVSIAQVSNVLGTINPIKEMVRIAHEHEVPVAVDGAQSTPHFKVDVQALDCDFFVFSGHKMYGPTGIGVLYGKEDWLDRLPPYQGGGEMIESVTFEKTVFEKLPFKFEAGTPDYVATHGLARAIDYMEAIGMDNINIKDYRGDRDSFPDKWSRNLVPIYYAYSNNPKISFVKRRLDESLPNYGGNIPQDSDGRELGFCNFPFRKLVISYKGDVLLCCNDFMYNTNFGNVMDHNILNCWNSDNFNVIRNELLQSQRTGLCENCNDSQNYNVFE